MYEIKTKLETHNELLGVDGALQNQLICCKYANLE